MEGEDHVGEHAEDEQLDPENRGAGGPDGDDLVANPHDDPPVQHVDGHHEAGRRRGCADASEIKKRVVGLGLPVDLKEDHPAVADRMEVGRRAVRPRPVGDRYDLDTGAVFHALDGHLRLDAEPVRGEIHPEERLAGERPVAREDIPVSPAVDQPEREVDEPVAELVESGHRPGTNVGEAVANDVFGGARTERFEHRVRIVRVVGQIGVGHQDVRRVDVVTDRLTNRLPLSLSGLSDHPCARLTGDLPGLIGRPAVDDEHVS